MAETPGEESLRPPERLQFGLGTALLVQAIFAVFLALLMTIGIFAVVLAFAATLILAWGPLRISNEPLRRMVFDLMAGVAMPVLCLWYDPCFIREYDQRVLVYLAIGLQILALPGWLIFDATTRRPSGFFAGVLIVGCFIASVIGTLMLPFSVVGLIAIIGVLGFTPFLTAYAFGRNAAQAFPPRSAEHGRRLFTNFLVASGITFAIGVPLVIYWGFGDHLNEWLKQVPFPDFFLISH